MSAKAFTVTQTALLFLGVMIGLTAIGEGAGVLMQRVYGALPPQSVTLQQAARQVPPEPRLEVDLLASRRAMVGPDRQAESYGWTDKANGRAHVPVEVAMRLMAQQGWPDSATPGGGS